VLEYTDRPGDTTQPRAHPDSGMVTLSAIRRRLHHDGGSRDVELTATRLPAQRHHGENIADTETHTPFIELKGWVWSC